MLLNLRHVLISANQLSLDTTSLHPEAGSVAAHAAFLVTLESLHISGELVPLYQQLHSTLPGAISGILRNRESCSLIKEMSYRLVFHEETEVEADELAELRRQ